MESLREEGFIGSHVEDIDHSIVYAAGADEVGVHIVAVKNDRSYSSAMSLYLFETLSGVDVLI